MSDWVITLPQKIEWIQYQNELLDVEDGQYVMNYRLPHKPSAQVGDRCFLVWRGKVRGWMHVVGIRDCGFMCHATEKVWPEGWYLQRSGRFNYISPQPEMKGFRGIRRYHG